MPFSLSVIDSHMFDSCGTCDHSIALCVENVAVCLQMEIPMGG